MAYNTQRPQKALQDVTLCGTDDTKLQDTWLRHSTPKLHLWQRTPINAAKEMHACSTTDDTQMPHNSDLSTSGVGVTAGGLAEPRRGWV